ncbi:MAG: (2Fe-2S)-binding protein [Methylococcaceae bacterium]
MNTNNPTPKEAPICHCTGTTQSSIERLIANNNTMQQVINLTGATTGCGACEYNIEQLFSEQKKP